MSDLDFQNGFIVGMATRGITRSGLMYAPLVWNDDGVFTFFYIDFKKPVADFSQGMFSESIVVHDSVQLAVTGIVRVSSSVFKIYADIAGRYQGITVLNKITSYLAFASGEKVPPFSVHFFVEGIDKYERMKYLYERMDFNATDRDVSETVDDLEMFPGFDIDAIVETSTAPTRFSTIVETGISVVLT